MKCKVIKQKYKIHNVFEGLNIFQLVRSSFDFINDTLVFDNNRFNARKVFKPLKQNNLQQNILAVVIIEAFFVLKDTSALIF